MIFNTMQRHAEAMIEAGMAGTDCLVLERVGIDFEGMDEAWGKALANKRRSTFRVPVLLFGKGRTLSISRFAGSNPGNASNHTFQKRGILYPKQWFPWREEEDPELTYDQWADLLSNLMEAPPGDVRSLFSKVGPLQTYDLDSPNLEQDSRKSVCLPVTCQKPLGIIHAILGCNALSLNAVGRSVIYPEILRFCLLMWVLDRAGKTIRVVPKTGDGRALSVTFGVKGGGNVGDLRDKNLVVQAGEGLIIGKKPSATSSPSGGIGRFLELTKEAEVKTVKLGAMAYTAPATGKSPTNAFLNVNGENSLSEDLRFGFDKKEIFPLVDGFAGLIRGTRFSLGGGLSYYVFPEKTEYMLQYIPVVRDLLSQLHDCRNRYFKQLRRSPGSNKAKKRRENKLRELLDLRRRMWGDAWNIWPVSDWIFAFEENVGSSNQQQNTWTAVYRHLPLVRTYLLLYTTEDPRTFGQLLQMLKATAHNLNERWEVKEVKRLFGAFFSGISLDIVQYWQRWRGYLVRSNQSETPIKPELWENAMNALLRIKAIDRIQANQNMTGMELITALDTRSEAMVMQNKERIQEYLAGLFPPNIRAETDTKKIQKAKQGAREFIEGRAADYARFVDVESTGWQDLVDGLICGWALKSVCRRLRKDDYASVIGGRSLAKQHPSEVRALMVDLVEKAVRAGDRPWNVDAPLEVLFRWSLRNAYSTETTLFMDALSLGFMRFDRKTNTEAGDE